SRGPRRLGADPGVVWEIPGLAWPTLEDNAMTQPDEPAGADTTWLVHDRFGLFIHWGLYSLAARHEWVKNRERIPDEDYDVYFRHFDPDLYDPAAWARAAEAAGMRYVVVTTK